MEISELVSSLDSMEVSISDMRANHGYYLDKLTDCGYYLMDESLRNAKFSNSAKRDAEVFFGIHISLGVDCFGKANAIAEFYFKDKDAMDEDELVLVYQYGECLAAFVQDILEELGAMIA